MTCEIISVCVDNHAGSCQLSRWIQRAEFAPI